MSIRYKVVKQSFGFDKTGTEKFVIKTVTGEMVSFDKVCNQVTQVCGAHRGTVSQVLGGLFDVAVNHLDMGHSIDLGEFGSLRTGLRTRAQDTEETANSSAVYRRKINFTPGKMFKNFLKDVSITRVPEALTSRTEDDDDDDNGGGYVDPEL